MAKSGEIPDEQIQYGPETGTEIDPLTAVDEVDTQPPPRLMMENYYEASLAEIRSANREIARFTPEEKSLWGDLQIALREHAANPRVREQIFKARNANFPEVGAKLERAQEYYAQGEQFRVGANRVRLVEAVKTTFGSDSAARVQRHFSAGAAEQAVDLAAKVQTNTSVRGVGSMAAQEAAAAAEQPAIQKLPEFDLIEDANSITISSQDSSVIAREFGISPVHMRSRTPLGSLYGEQAFGPTNLFESPARNQYSNVDYFAKFATNPYRNFSLPDRGEISVRVQPFEVDNKLSIENALQSFDSPTVTEALKLRVDRFGGNFLRVFENNQEVLGGFAEPFKQDLDLFLNSRGHTAKQKEEFISQLERLTDPSHPELVAGNVEKFVLSLQLLHQAAHIETIDQAEFGVCALTGLEKRLLAKRPELVAKMVTDAALTGLVTTATGKTVHLHKSCLAPSSEKSMMYPPQDEQRSLATQYVSMILGNVRLQLFNEKFGTKLVYAHYDKRDMIVDLGGTEPSMISGLDPETGAISRDKFHRHSDGKIVLNEFLNPEPRNPIESPMMFDRDVLDTYAAVTGESAARIGLVHYTMARDPSSSFSIGNLYNWFNQSEPVRDHRYLVYRNEQELKAHLLTAKRTDNFPLLFLEPRHVTTVNGFDPAKLTVDHDNQWGDSRDHIGPNARTVSELEKIGKYERPVSGYAARYKELIDGRRSYRDQYEKWCAANHVELDTRYPTADEFKAWQGK